MIGRRSESNKFSENSSTLTALVLPCRTHHHRILVNTQTALSDGRWWLGACGHGSPPIGPFKRAWSRFISSLATWWSRLLSSRERVSHLFSSSPVVAGWQQTPKTFGSLVVFVLTQAKLHPSAYTWGCSPRRGLPVTTTPKDRASFITRRRRRAFVQCPTTAAVRVLLLRDVCVWTGAKAPHGLVGLRSAKGETVCRGRDLYGQKGGCGD